MSGDWKEYDLPISIDSYAHWYDFPDLGGARLEAPQGRALFRLSVPPDSATGVDNLVTLGTAAQEALASNGTTTLSLNSGTYERLLQANPEFDKELRERGISLAQCAGSLPGNYIDSKDVQDQDNIAREPLPENSVITAIIDDGIGFANERFRDGLCSTRIEYFWDQNPRHPNPTTIQSGLELTKAQIDELLHKHEEDGNIDEEALYRAAGVVDYAVTDENPSALSWSHGTHVMDIAAGHPMNGAPANNPIIAVQLPPQIVARTNGLGTACYAQAAIEWIGQRADLLRQRMGRTEPLPIVINFSFGDYAGRHDGLDAFERFIDSVLQPEDSPLKAVFLPAGNSLLQRTHAKVSTNDVIQRDVDLKFRVQPGNKETTFIQIWLPAILLNGGEVSNTQAKQGMKQSAEPDASQDGGLHDRLKLELIAPGGSIASPPSDKGPDSFLEYVEDGRVIARIYKQLDNDFISAPPDRFTRMKITIAVQPTEADEDDQPIAPSGLWTLRMSNGVLENNAVIDAWIERGDTPTGYRPRGRQTYFEDPCYSRFVEPECAEGRPVGDWEEQDQSASYIKREGTISPIATGDLSTAIGAYRAADREAAFYSSAGPFMDYDGREPDPNLVHEGPDLAMVGEDSRIRSNRLASGTLSGSIKALRGTSVAAPLAARKAVEILQERPKTGKTLRERIRKQALRDDPKDRNGKRTENPNRIGDGRLKYEFKRTKSRRVMEDDPQN